jgi:hypothetical protein
MQTQKDPIEQISRDVSDLKQSIKEVLLLLEDRPQYQIEGLVSTVQKHGKAITKLQQDKQIREAKIGVISGLGGGSIVLIIWKIAKALGIGFF